MPAGARYVGRPGPYGNPIRFLDVSLQYPSLSDTQVAMLVVRMFEDLVKVGRLALPNWRFADGHRGPVAWTYPDVATIRADLAGWDLCCWCALGEPCHVDVLLSLANGGGAS